MLFRSVTDDERNLKWVGLNQKVTLGEKLSELPPEQAQGLVQQMGIQGPQDPRMQEVVEVRNDVSGLDVDIVIEEGPDITTLQSEQFDMLSKLAQSGIGIPPKAIIQASSIRNKDAILDEMEKGVQLPPDVQERIQAAQEEMQRLSDELKQVQLQNQQLTMQLQETRADTGIAGAELEIKGRELDLKGREIDIKELEAYTAAQQAAAMPAMQGQQEMAEPQHAAPAQPQQIVVHTAESESVSQGMLQAVSSLVSLMQGQSEQSAAILSAVQQSGEQNLAATAQFADVIQQALTAPKTAKLSNGKTITVQTGVAQ